MMRKKKMRILNKNAKTEFSAVIIILVLAGAYYLISSSDFIIFPRSTTLYRTGENFVVEDYGLWSWPEASSPTYDVIGWKTTVAATWQECSLGRNILDEMRYSIHYPTPNGDEWNINTIQQLVICRDTQRWRVWDRNAAITAIQTQDFNSGYTEVTDPIYENELFKVDGETLFIDIFYKTKDWVNIVKVSSNMTLSVTLEKVNLSHSPISGTALAWVTSAVGNEKYTLTPNNDIIIGSEPVVLDFDYPNLSTGNYSFHFVFGTTQLHSLRGAIPPLTFPVGEYVTIYPAYSRKIRFDYSLPLSGGGVACNSNSECGTDTKLSSFCGTDGNIYDIWKVYTCMNPGQTTSFCSEENQDRLNQICSNGCSLPGGNATCNSGGSGGGSSGGGGSSTSGGIELVSEARKQLPVVIIIIILGAVGYFLWRKYR